MQKFIIHFFISVLFCLSLSAATCTKVVTYGSDVYTMPVARSYYSDLPNVLRQTEQVLELMGYEILSTDESRNRITTGWRPVTSDSHYYNLFKRKDFGAAQGAYYQLIVDVADRSPQIQVAISTTVKSVAGRLQSLNVLENEVLNRLDDQLRSPQIEVTNVGVKNR